MVWGVAALRPDLGVGPRSCSLVRGEAIQGSLVKAPDLRSEASDCGHGGVTCSLSH